MVGDPRRVDRVSSVLVGRSEALDLAERRWNETIDGPGHVLLVTGEAGIGKTRLLAELPARLGGTVSVVDAATFPRDAQAAGAVILALADGFRRAGLADTGALLRGRLLEPDGAGDARRRRLLVGDLAELVVGVMTDRLTLLRIEDLHWADDLSLDVLDRVAVGLRTGHSMVVATFRSDELAPSTALGRWRGRLLSQRLAEEVRLPRLDRASTGAIVEAVTGEVPSAEFLNALHLRSDGIPLHIEELLAGGSLDDVPDTVAESVVARAETLDPLTRGVLDAGAVIGRSFDLDLLGAVAGQSADVIDAALGRLMASYLVVPLGDLFVFRHALICDAVYAVIPPHRRRRLHADVAVAAARYGLSDSYVSDHYERAKDDPNAHRHALAGARYATRVSAHREAAELLRRAQRTVPADLGASARASLDAELAVELAAIDDNEGAAANLEAAIELLRSVGDEESAAALVPRLMAAHHLLGLGLAGRARLAHDALARLDRTDGGGSALVRAGLHGALAAAHMLDRRLDEALDYGSRAAAVFGDTLARADVDLTVGSVLVFAGRPDDGWALLESTIATSARAGLEAETARGYRMLATSASVLVEYDRAERWLADGLDYTLRTERENDHHYLAAHLAHVHWARGRWTASELLARDALANGRGITTRITARVVLGYLDLGRGRLDSARAVLESALQLAEPMAELQRISPVLWGLAEVALHGGDAALAVDLAEQGYAQSARVADAAYLFPFVVTGTRAYLAQHQSDLARNWVRRCSDLLRMRDLPGTLPALTHAEGLIELAEGQTGAARTLLEEALARWESCGRAWEAGLALVDLAHCAARSRRPADAAQFVEDAHARAADGDLLDTLATAVNLGEAVVGPLSRREEEVAALVASGLTNREIASRLVISPKTASTHVEHILTKLGASRRAEIAVWVTRREV